MKHMDKKFPKGNNLLREHTESTLEKQEKKRQDKKRSQELCRQVRGANLGDPAQFGCISNPDAVGPDYSWKGNFTMVCNRLGDTWGGWYPEMFGCPKYDPTQKFRGTML